MKKSSSRVWPWTIVAGIIILVSAWVVWLAPGSLPSQAAEPGQAQAAPSTKQGQDKASAADTTMATLPGILPSQNAPPNPPPRSALDSTTYPDFRSDRQGQLVLDELTRDGLERVMALNDRDAAQVRIGALSKHLPPGARRQAEDLYFRYQQYTAALGQAFTPGDQPPSDDAALQQLDALHALRIEHFGADTAKALFASDEETARQLILLMRSQAAADLGHEQKVELAQQTYDRMKAATKPPR